MEFVLSGYGLKPDTTIASFVMNSDGSYERIWETSIENASFVCQGEGYLFTITEVEDYCIVYMYQRKGTQYELVDYRQLEGGALCHIAYSSRNKALFGACYGSGTVFSIQVEEDRFGEVVFQEIQKGVDASELTRAHCVVLNQEETQLIVANIALDQIYFYHIVCGSLKQQYVIELPKKVGPRHVLFSPDEKLLYVITEYSNEIFTYDMLSKQLLQRISTLSEDYLGESYCSTLCFSLDRRFLYAANRLADTIALFSVGAQGKLSRITEFSCGGSNPRHMIISSDGRYLIVCNQNSDNVKLFSLDTSTGYPQTEVKNIKFRTPSGVIEI
jgi:6-phosphogluconolactonase